MAMHGVRSEFLCDRITFGGVLIERGTILRAAWRNPKVSVPNDRSIHRFGVVACPRDRGVDYPYRLGWPSEIIMSNYGSERQKVKYRKEQCCNKAMRRLHLLDRPTIVFLKMDPKATSAQAPIPAPGARWAVVVRREAGARVSATG